MEEIHGAGIDDLVRAHIRVRQGPHYEVEYWERLRDTLGPLLMYGPVDRPLVLFRVNPDRPPDHADKLHDELVRDTLEALSPMPNPFEKFMEAPGRIVELSQKHGREIQAAQEVLRDAVADLIRNILVMRWPGIEASTVIWSTLVAEGVDRHPPEPPGWDDW